MKKIISYTIFCILFSQYSKCQAHKPSTQVSVLALQNNDSITTIDNGILTLRLDLTRGGAISYLSLSGSPGSFINIADEGRYIQQSYYAGKRVDRRSDGQSPRWSP